jgi:hypothetical protein
MDLIGLWGGFLLSRRPAVLRRLEVSHPSRSLMEISLQKAQRPHRQNSVLSVACAALPRCVEVFLTQGHGASRDTIKKLLKRQVLTGLHNAGSAF